MCPLFFNLKFVVVAFVIKRSRSIKIVLRLLLTLSQITQKVVVKRKMNKRLFAKKERLFSFHILSLSLSFTSIFSLSTSENFVLFLLLRACVVCPWVEILIQYVRGKNGDEI